MIHFVGISTVVCDSFWGVEKNQNGGRCYGNQGIKWSPNTTVAILKILSPKLCVHMSEKISGKFHPIPNTIANQR
jgi:hypothetical protein